MTDAVEKFNQLAVSSNRSPEELRHQLREKYLSNQERIRAGHADTVLPEKANPD
jgi:hypothetical protein